MSWYNFWKSEKKSETESDEGASPRSGYKFTDLDRMRSAQLRRMERELREKEHLIYLKQRERELEELEAELDDSDEDDEEDNGSVEDKLMSRILDLAAGATVGASVASAQDQKMSDDKIREILKAQPKEKLELAKKAPEGHVRQAIKKEMPDMDDASITRALQILKSEF
jgi:hypothetical protein